MSKDSNFIGSVPYFSLDFDNYLLKVLRIRKVCVILRRKFNAEYFLIITY